jgi:putative transcriptional regulator
VCDIFHANRGEDSLKVLKNKLRTLRFMNGEMTQQELADKVGVTRQTIHAIESGKFNPSVKLALLIAKTFQVNVEDTFYLEGE